MGALRTSEEGGDVLGGEAQQARSDDDRRVDAPGQIIIDSAPIVAIPPAARPVAVPPRPLTYPAAPQKPGGRGLLVIVYLLATAALGAAVYERFLM